MRQAGIHSRGGLVGISAAILATNLFVVSSTALADNPIYDPLAGGPALSAMSIPAGATVTLDDAPGEPFLVVSPQGTEPFAYIGSYDNQQGTASSSNGLPTVAVFTFSSINIPAGVTFAPAGGDALVLLSQGNITVDSDINASGGNGNNGVTSPSEAGGAGGSGVMGGYSGGHGGFTNASGSFTTLATSGGGPGGAFGGIDSSSDIVGGGGGGFGGYGGGEDSGGPYGAAASGLYGGSGGAGGPPTINSNLTGGPPGGGGGAGGGAVELDAIGSLTIGANTHLLANGGTGGSESGGGGSGGTIRLSANTILIDGVASANGGNPGPSDVVSGGGAGGRAYVQSSAAVSQFGNPDENVSVNGGTDADDGELDTEQATLSASLDLISLPAVQQGASDSASINIANLGLTEFGLYGISQLYGYADVNNTGVYADPDPAFAVNDDSSTTITVPLDTSQLGPQVDLLQIYSNGGNQIVPIDFTVIPVPEPLALAMTLPIAGIALSRRRGRRRE
jgi:hypothetical protein